MKQDRQGVRKASDLERKYDLGVDVGEIKSLAANAQTSAERANNVARDAQNTAAKANATATSAKNTAEQASQTAGTAGQAAAKNTTSIEELEKRVDELEKGGSSEGGASLETVYPVGSIYLSVLETNPATLFGFGTWEQIKDKFLLSAGDTYAAGSEGGEAEHTLTVDEMPAHRHGLGYTDYGPGSGSTSLVRPTIYSYTSTDATGTLSVGGDQPHNNMPPYLAVYVWQRTA